MRSSIISYIIRYINIGINATVMSGFIAEFYPFQCTWIVLLREMKCLVIENGQGSFILYREENC